MGKKASKGKGKGKEREGKGREGRKDDAHRRPYLEQKEGLRLWLRGGIESFGIGV